MRSAAHSQLVVDVGEMRLRRLCADRHLALAKGEIGAKPVTSGLPGTFAPSFARRDARQSNRPVSAGLARSRSVRHGTKEE